MKNFVRFTLTSVLVAAAAVGGPAAQNSTDALFDAVRSGDPAAVRNLLTSGADANAKDIEGMPVLM